MTEQRCIELESVHGLDDSVRSKKDGQTETQEISIWNAAGGDGVQITGTTLVVRDGKEGKSHVGAITDSELTRVLGTEGDNVPRR